MVGPRTPGVLLVMALLCLWEISATQGWVNSANWPSFMATLIAVKEGVVSGELPKLLSTTLYRTLVGFAIGSALGVATSIVLGAASAVSRAVSPVLEMFRPMPVSAIVPPLILFLGIGDRLAIFIVAFAAYFPVLVNTTGGLRANSETLLQTARTFRKGWLATLWHVVLPGALPSIFAGLRTSLGISLVVAIVAEMISGSNGLGYFIVQTQYAMLPAPMYGAVICLAVVGYGLNRLFLQVEALLIPWYTPDREDY